MHDKIKTYIIWIAGLSFFPKLIISLVVLLLATLILFAIWQPQMFGINQELVKKKTIKVVDKHTSNKVAPIKGTVSFDYSTNNGRIKIGEFPFDFEIMWTKASSDAIHIYNDPPSIDSVGVARGIASFEEIRDISNIDFSSRAQTPQEGDFVILKNKRGYFAALRIMDIKDNTRSDDIDEVKFEFRILNNRSNSFFLSE